jgi:hypothetical protein
MALVAAALGGTQAQAPVQVQASFVAPVKMTSQVSWGSLMVLRSLGLALVWLSLASWSHGAEIETGAPIEAAVRLADWQLARMGGAAQVSRQTEETVNPRAWEQAVFWVGMTALADALADAGGPPRIRESIIAKGNANRWLPGDRPYFADDHAITQSYLWAAANGAGSAASTPTRKAFDKVVGEPAVTTLAFYVPP